MDNRRQAYRLPFAPEDALRIALRPLGKKGDFTAELVDLSVAGMRVRLRDAAPSIAVGDTLACRFLGRPESASAELNLTLSLSARIVHRETEGEATILGLQFLPTASPGANENIERTLNVFILAEQRRRRQRQRADEDRRP